MSILSPDEKLDQMANLLKSSPKKAISLKSEFQKSS